MHHGFAVEFEDSVEADFAGAGVDDGVLFLPACLDCFDLGDDVLLGAIFIGIDDVGVFVSCCAGSYEVIGIAAGWLIVFTGHRGLNSRGGE